MRHGNQAKRIRQHKRIPLCEPRSLDRLENKQRRPRRSRLRHGINQDEHKRPLGRRPAQLVVDPPIKHARHGHRRVRRGKGEPLGRLGHGPDDEDHEANGVPYMCRRDGPRRPQEEVRREANKQRVHDAEGGCYGAELVDMGGRVPAEALEPEQKAAGIGVVACVPEKDVEPEQGPKLPVPRHTAEGPPLKLALGHMSSALEALDR